MSFILYYIKKKMNTISVLLILYFLLAISFILYHLPLEAVLYPIAICTFITVVIGLLDCHIARKKHNKLVELARVPENILEELRFFNSINDTDYKEIIEACLDENRELRTKNKRQNGDMTDYYTAWAHQIKTPISSMRITLQNEDSSLSRIISDDLSRIEQYVDMVMCYIRLDSDSTDYVFREYDLDNIVKQSLRKTSEQFILRGIRLCYEPLNCKAVTDEKWLMFVFEQILSNALKYTKSGTISIYMQDRSLCIRDTGIGIKPEDLPRIFEKGYTGMTGRNDKKASGLGLYLCKRICKNLGHEISAESEVGVGTVMKIKFELKNTLHE